MTNMTEFYSRIYWLNKSDSLTTPLGKTNLNHMDSAIKTLDGRTVELYTEAVRLDTTKADKNQLKGMVTNWQIDDRTGIVTLTKYDGTKVSINTALNQLAVNFDYDAVNQQLVITQTDGTQKIVDMSALITQYEFLDTDTVSFFVDENGKVSAKVKEGSIEEKHLQPNYLADIKVETAKAQGYAAKAQESADNAAYEAKLAQSYAIGGSGIRENEDTDNARVYAEKAKESADTAQELVGGKFIPADEKGAAGGVASLDNDGKVPKAQLPDDIGSGTSNESKSILNMFDEQPASLNVNMSDPSIINRITYMLATSSTTEGKPPSNAMVINMGWNGSGYGAQLAVGIAGENLWTRGRKTDGSYIPWLEYLSTKNYSSEIRRINNQLILVHGSYVSKQLGTNGTAGIINFMRIKVTGPYVNYPLYFLLSGRGRQMPMLVCVHFASVNSVDPELNSFYRLLTDGYDVYIHKTSASTWDLYAPKNEPYGRVDVLHIWYSSDDFQISYPNTQVASASSSWIKATTAGIVENANALKDCGNGTQIHISYSKHGLAINNTTWLAGWNNYELRAIHRNNFMQAKNLNGFYGMVVGNYEDNVWVRTTSQGIIPYQNGGRGYGHQQLGTDSWYFLKSYIDQMHGVTLDLSGTITSRVNTSTHINGAKGVNVGINMLNAGSGYTILATLKSTNGVFCIGQYQGIFHIYYIANTLINANSNGVTKDLKLLDELGNSEFPGTLNAGALNSRGNISGGAATFNSVTANSGLIKGNLRLQDGNYGQKINFGDSEYVYLYEDIDDHLKIYAKAGAEINCANTYYIKMGIMTVDTDSGYKGTKLYAGAGVSVPNFTPIHDIGCTLGAPSYRWNHIYARDSSISTSDRAEKKEVSYIGKSSDYDTYMDDETLKSFISGLLPVIYKRINGESGRPHHGFIAQDIEKLLQKLNIKDHAGFIKSPKTEIIEIEEEVEEEYVDEADGQTKTRTVIQKREEQREKPGEYIYGLRYEEFIADIVRFVQIQDERIEEQEKIIQGQQEEIDSLKARLERLEALMLY